MSRLYYKEIQRFNPLWIWIPNLIMVAVLIVVFFLEYRPMHTGIETRQEYWFFLTLLVPAGITVLMYYTRMETEIRRAGIYYRLIPFMFRFRFIRWEEMNRCYVRTYQPIKEYGGWGWRTSWGRRNIAINIKGNIGIQMELKNGRKILLGTSKGKEVESVLNSLEIPHLTKSHEG